MNAIDRTQPALTPEALGRAPVSVEPYRDPRYFEIERERIFRRAWLCVGRDDELRRPGDFIVKDVPVCEASVLIVRGENGAVRAFHNVCKHRGNKLVWDEGGHTKAFTCRYHAWSYALDGEVRAVPDAAMFFDLDKAACALTPIHIDVWRGFIFLNFDETPRQSLKDYLGGLGEKLDGFPFEQFSAYVTISGIYNGNWKIAVDGFQESYHLGYLHKDTIGPIFSSGPNPTGRMISAEFFGPHRSGSVWGNAAGNPRPIEAKAFSFGAMVVSGNMQAGMAGAADLPDGINPTKDPNWGVEMNVIFPNTLIFANRQGFAAHYVQPLSHDRTRWDVELHFRPATNARQLFAQQFQLALSRDTFVEDALTINYTQQALKSGAIKSFQFQDSEVFPRHFNRVVEQFLAAE